MTANSPLLDRFHHTREGIEAAARKYGRSPSGIGLLAVSKQHPISAIRELANAGQRDFGESYLQEALPKIQALKDLDLTWHFIGQIQSNKTRTIAEYFHWAHTIDRLKIAQRLNEQRPHYAPPLQVCIQIKLGEEAGKGGVTPEEAGALAQHIAGFRHLKLRGLMCIPPPMEDFASQRAAFERMAQLLEKLRGQGLALDTLSMGMSGDLEAAIAAGSTLVRVGTAIFGERIYE